MFKIVYNMLINKGGNAMKCTIVAKLLLQVKKLFSAFIQQKSGILMSYSFKSDDENTFYISFVINTNDYEQNTEIVKDFMQKYNLDKYVKLENINHIKTNNYMETILTLKMTSKGKRNQNKLLTALRIKED